MSVSEERLLSLEDVAERLQVSDQSVRRWIKAGKLAAYKPGLEWRIRPSDLEDFLETHSSPKVQAPLSSADQRRAFIERCDRHVAARVADFERRLAVAENGGFPAVKALRVDAFEEFLQFCDLTNGELVERWLDDPEVPEAVKEE